MKLLALDTATEACSAALQVGDSLRARFEVAGRDHTRRLPAMVTALLAEAGLRVQQLDGIACGIGPGSFAGVRIGIGFAKGLALAAGVPVVGVTSLEMLAEGQPSDSVLTVIDARLAAVYAAAWQRTDGGWRPVLPPRLCAPADLPKAPAGGDTWAAVGTGFGAYRELLLNAWGAPMASVQAEALPRAAAAVPLARLRFQAGEGVAAEALTPCYLRDKVALTLIEQQQHRASVADPSS